MMGAVLGESWRIESSPRRQTGAGMAYTGVAAGRVPSDGGASLFAKVAWTVAAFSFALGTAAWITGFDPVPWASDPAPSKDPSTASFESRFSQVSLSNSSSTYVPRRLVQSIPSELKTKFEQAKGLLGPKPSQDSQAALIEEPRPSSVAAVPLPRSRPVEASLELKGPPPVA